MDNWFYKRVPALGSKTVRSAKGVAANAEIAFSGNYRSNKLGGGNS
jgi:hypothetical protein